MSDLRTQYLICKAKRDDARAAFDNRVADLRADFEERGIAGRILDETIEQSMDMFDEAVEIVQDHPRAFTGTILALGLWMLRNPIMAQLNNWVGFDRDIEKDPDHEQD